MTTNITYPKDVIIKIYHIPSSTTYQTDKKTINNDSEMESVTNVCLIMTNPDARNCMLIINGVETYFPVGVLQNSIIRLMVS